MAKTVTSRRTVAEQRAVLKLNNEESNKLTREYIRTAMIYLANEKPFNEISITELTRRAGVSRTAFYRNYDSKNDVLKEIGQNVISETAKLISNTELSVHSRLIMIFEGVRDHQKDVRMLLHCKMPMENLFPNGQLLESIFPSKSIEDHYRKIAADAVMSSIVREWVNSGLKETPEEMTAIVEQIGIV